MRIAICIIWSYVSFSRKSRWFSGEGFLSLNLFNKRFWIILNWTVRCSRSFSSFRCSLRSWKCSSISSKRSLNGISWSNDTIWCIGRFPNMSWSFSTNSRTRSHCWCKWFDWIRIFELSFETRIDTIEPSWYTKLMLRSFLKDSSHCCDSIISEKKSGSPPIILPSTIWNWSLHSMLSLYGCVILKKNEVGNLACCVKLVLSRPCCPAAATDWAFFAYM